MSGGLVARLEDELADVAREIAKLLTNPPVDMATLAALDHRADVLRQRVRAAYPAEPAPDLILHYGSRLLLLGESERS